MGVTFLPFHFFHNTLPILSFLSLLSLGSNAKTDGAFHSKTVHCINLLYLCHKKKRHPNGCLFFLWNWEMWDLKN